jgi:hypothetical protein
MSSNIVCNLDCPESDQSPQWAWQLPAGAPSCLNKDPPPFSLPSVPTQNLSTDPNPLSAPAWRCRRRAAAGPSEPASAPDPAGSLGRRLTRGPVPVGCNRASRDEHPAGRSGPRPDCPAQAGPSPGVSGSGGAKSWIESVGRAGRSSLMGDKWGVGEASAAAKRATGASAVAAVNAAAAARDQGGRVGTAARGRRESWDGGARGRRAR